MPDVALAVCQSCGMPVRVTFDSEGEIARVLATCSHVEVVVARPEGDEG